MIEGSTVGQYRIVRKIGEGGMGAVYLAEHTLIGRRAAIKVLLPALSMQREIVDRFFNEARATTSVPDPGIVQVFDFGFHTDGSAFIVMEFLEGEPLDTRLKRFGRLSAFDALRLTRGAASSLHAAHSRGIVHRDLKPENIFLVPDSEAQGGERPKILDFGIAKLGGNEPGQMRTRTGALMGTPVYMSPEQCRGAGSVDHRSDIYSMGCVIFHMLTGRPPFEAEGVGEIIAAHLREAPPPPSALAPGIPPAVDELVLRCLAKSPDDRFQTMAELGSVADQTMTRITASGASAPTVAVATPLAPGFRSEYPGQASAPVPGTVPPAAGGSYPGGSYPGGSYPGGSYPGTAPAGATMPLGHATGPGQPTTLSAAAGTATTPPVARSGRKLALWAGLIAVGGIAAAAVALSMGGGGGDRGGGDGTAAASGGTAQPVAAGALDAGAAATTPPDATTAVAVAVDAAVDAPVDAGVAVATGTDDDDATDKTSSKSSKHSTHSSKHSTTSSSKGTKTGSGSSTSKGTKTGSGSSSQDLYDSR